MYFILVVAPGRRAHDVVCIFKGGWYLMVDSTS